MTRQRTACATPIVLGCAAIVLLCLAAVFLSHVYSARIQTMRAQATHTRAHLMAHAIGQSLSEAVAAGIPLHHLVGVPPFLEHWRKNHPEALWIAVHDLQGKTLWRSPVHAAEDDMAQADTASGQADVAWQGNALARVQVQLRSDRLALAGRAAGVLIPAVLLVSALATLAALFSCAQGPWLRHHGLRMSARWAVRGDYRRLLVLPQHRHFDVRVEQVAQAMREVHERMARMRQLIGSLRRTEPQQSRRDLLDQILQKTESNHRFTQHAPTITRLVPAQSQAMWIATLLCLAAVSPLALVLRDFQSAAVPAVHGLFAGQALTAWTLALLLLSTVAGWQLCSRLPLSALGVLILSSAALLLPLLARLEDATFHPAWMAVWNGGFAGTALAACTRAQPHPDQHPDFVHARPYLSGAALLAWWAGLLWLAPALGLYADEALPNALAELALLLPGSGGLFFAMRWGGAHSPWRTRMTAPARHLPPQDTHQRLRWAVLGCAAGLLAGNGTGVSDAARLLQQCALGLGMGLGCISFYGKAAAGRSTPSGWPLWRTVTWAAATVPLIARLDARFSAWLPPPGLEIALLLSHLWLGLLLGQGLVQAADPAQNGMTLQLLLSGALGAALCAVLHILGLPDGPTLLAALLLAQAPGRLRKKALHAD